MNVEESSKTGGENLLRKYGVADGCCTASSEDAHMLNLQPTVGARGQNQTMPNQLTVGKPRYGSLSTGNTDTSEVSATLERTSEGIFVSITFSHDESPEYAQWFTPNYFDIAAVTAEKTQPRPPVPSTLFFYDSHGPVALVGCRNAGYHTNHRIGSGRVYVGAAVLAAPSTAHAKVMGMRSTVSGLRAWLGTSAISHTTNFDKQTGRFKSAEIQVVIPEVIDIPDSKLVLRPAINRTPRDGALMIEDIVWVEHKTEEESSWRLHQLAMRAVRDLLAVSRWRDESLIPVSVARTEDSIKGDTPESERQQWWRDVADSSAPEPKEETRRLEHLILWEDLGPEGLANWIKLRDDFARAVDPAVSSIYLEGVTVEVQLTQIAISLEALGYLLFMRKDGASETKAGGISFQRRLNRIVQEVPGLLPFVDATWSQRMADTYNSVKHANRDLPQTVDVANSWREGALLFRTWIANELGVERDKLRERIARDSQIHSFIVAGD
ncbi:HEPN domain-containing protein [Arthrobacter crystallopoietes]|uniref:ApeA N-terminal domain 1-containing protein n=1 Tax=Crystallibacter crystallopoietes TaxID=37928 RepID=UPI0011140889|nr:HEPN domain-containing protein [Arthrobacter crystallopoietes]